MTATLAAVGWLFLVVAFGAVVPVVPTGAAVSAAAALALHRQDPVTVGLVLLAGAAGAYVGDLVMYALCRRGGVQLARRLRWLRDPARLTGVQERLRDGGVPILLVSRLLPGGRVPVLLAAGLVGLDWRTFVGANVPACLLWSLVYGSIGVLGGSILPEPWQGVLAAIVLVVLISRLLAWWGRRRSA